MPVTSSEKATTCHLTWEYEEGQLFQEFVPALLVEGEYVPISTGSYITNPEMIASNQDSRLEVNSKKGLLIDPETLETPLLEDLGVKHAIYNIPLSIIPPVLPSIMIIEERPINLMERQLMAMIICFPILPAWI